MEKYKKDYISIVIPTYNSAKYIINLLECIKRQTYRYFEVIIIDDGSKDNTKDIVNNFINQNKEMEIHYIYKENGGVSSARNLGIENANYEYVMFLDSDDMINDNILEKLIKKRNDSKADLVVTNAKIVGSKKEYFPRLKYENDSKLPFITSIFSQNVSAHHYNFRYEFCRSACSRLYINKILKDNNVRFDEKMFLFEDGFFNLTYFKYIDSVAYINEPLYTYLVENGSSSKYRSNLETENTYKIKTINQLTKEMDNNIKIAKNIYFLDLFSKYIKNFLNNKNNKLNNNEKTKKIKELISSELYLDILDISNFKYLNLKKKLVFILLKLHLYKLVIIILK